jgi:hypothetical protein
MNEENTLLPTRRQALKMAQRLGCSGAHQEGDSWMPCDTHEELVRIVNDINSLDEKDADCIPCAQAAEMKALLKKKRKKKGSKPGKFEELGERGVLSIDTLEGGGFVSGPVVKSESSLVRVGLKSRSIDNFAVRRATAGEEKAAYKPRNRSGSASSAETGKNISFDDRTIRALENKVKEHNAKVLKAGKPEWSKTNLRTLKAVYQRGAGAYSTSHRKGMQRDQWAMGRVNAFLKILISGKPDNKRYVTDNDLLHGDHPWKKDAKAASKRIRLN